jgi:ADP-dependent NAD(P)H-hydrate dehydratase / NAD(P)H-hydrate epimerase
MKILSASQMRRVEQRCAERGIPSSVLTENAGRAVAAETRRLLGPVHQKVLVLVGPGNNGGDGEVAARYLKGWGFDVTVCLTARRPLDDPNLALVKEARVPVIEFAQEDVPLSALQEELASASAVLDCVFGTGFKPATGASPGRAIGPRIASLFGLVGRIRKQRREFRVLAVDLPSGLDADTAVVDPASLFADVTMVLGYPKPGLFSSPGAECAGRLTVLDIGIPAGLVEDSIGEMLTDDMVRTILPQRPAVSSKGTFGKVMVVAGSLEYAGAAYLSCSGALRSGAGLVTLAVPESLVSVITRPVEATCLPLPDAVKGRAAGPAAVIRRGLAGYEVLLIGPGLGRQTHATGLVHSLLFGRKRLECSSVIDADALNILAAMGARSPIWRRLADDAILTPHPGEMARLTGSSVSDVQRDRIGVARESARDWHKTVVLKGAYTVVVGPEGKVMVVPFANASLASAGTGDVLSGAIAGFVAQGLSLFDAAVAGVYVHGKAGELLGRRSGDAGTTATDLLADLPLAIREIKAG